MRTIEIKDRTITVDGRTLRATWTQEVVDDLKMFHDIDFTEVVADALVHEIAFELNAEGNPITDEEKKYYKAELLEHLE